MSGRTHEQLLRDYFRQVSADYYTADAVLRDMSSPGPLHGREAIRRFLRMYLEEGFPDGRYELHRVMSDAGGVMAEWTFRGTNTGPLMGTEPTGRRVEFSGVSVYEVEGELFSRARIYYDTGALADQLGLTGGRVPPGERARWGEWWEDG